MPTTRRFPRPDTTTPLPKLRKDLSAPGLLRAIRGEFAKLGDPRNGCTIPLVDALMSGLAVFGRSAARLEVSVVAAVRSGLSQRSAHPKQPAAAVRDRVRAVRHAVARAAARRTVRPGRPRGPARGVSRCASPTPAPQGPGALRLLERPLPAAGRRYRAVRLQRDQLPGAAAARCCRKTTRGKSSYYHQLLAAVIAHPERNTVLPLMPEAITRQDGAAKNDCERNAAKRLLRRVREDQPRGGPPKFKCIVVEDSLAGNGPHIELLESLDMRYILGTVRRAVKPGDHAKLFEQVHEALNTERCHEREIIDTPKRERGYRWINGLTLNAAHPDRRVNYLEHWEIIDGKQRIWSWVTDLPLDADTVVVFARAGRARWKVENETFNTLKNQGYHRAADRLEHNYGHGRQHLSTVFAQLMMLAFLVDQIQESSCRLFQAARDRFHARIVLWQKLRALFSEFHVADWTTLWTAMIRGHHAVLSPDTS